MASKTIPCSICKKKLKLWQSKLTDKDVLVVDGNVWHVQCNYGSNFDTKRVRLCICDECLEKIEVKIKDDYPLTNEFGDV